MIDLINIENSIMENLETNDNTDEYDVVSIDTIEILSKEEELNMALIEIELSDEDELDSEIQRLTNEIERIKDNKPKKACELRVKLEKCDKIKSLFGEISQNKNTTTISGEQELPKSNIETSKKLTLNDFSMFHIGFGVEFNVLKPIH